jgi:hypothetical protein
VEVGLHFPREFHDQLKEYPVCPENTNVRTTMVGKTLSAGTMLSAFSRRNLQYERKNFLENSYLLEQNNFPIYIIPFFFLIKNESIYNNDNNF